MTISKILEDHLKDFLEGKINCVTASVVPDKNHPRPQTIWYIVSCYAKDDVTRGYSFESHPSSSEKGLDYEGTLNMSEITRHIEEAVKIHEPHVKNADYVYTVA